MNQTNPTSERSGLLAQLFEQFGLAARLFVDGRVPTVYKVLLPLLVLGYFIFPIDLLPDFIPGLGQLDDLAIILVAIRLFVMLAPEDVVTQYRDHTGAGDMPTSAAGGSADWTQTNGTGNVVDATYRIKD